MEKFIQSLSRAQMIHAAPSAPFHLRQVMPPSCAASCVRQQCAAPRPSLLLSNEMIPQHRTDVLLAKEWRSHRVSKEEGPPPLHSSNHTHILSTLIIPWEPFTVHTATFLLVGSRWQLIFSFHTILTFKLPLLFHSPFIFSSNVDLKQQTAILKKNSVQLGIINTEHPLLALHTPRRTTTLLVPTSCYVLSSSPNPTPTQQPTPNQQLEVLSRNPVLHNTPIHTYTYKHTTQNIETKRNK